MTRKKARIRLELTECQKEQIRKATGREVNALELGLEGLPEPAEPPRRRRQTDDTGRRSGERRHDTAQERSNGNDDETVGSSNPTTKERCHETPQFRS